MPASAVQKAKPAAIAPLLRRMVGGRRSAIAFDVGAAGVRAVQCRRANRAVPPGGPPAGGVPANSAGPAVQIEDLLAVELLPTEPPEAAAEEQAIAAPAVDASQLRRLIGQGRFVGRDVVLVLSPPDVEFHPLRLPEAALSQNSERIEQALKFEVARDSRAQAGELEVRYWKLPPARGQAANVMAVVTPTATALRWCETLACEHLLLKRLDVAPCALVRAACASWNPVAEDLWGLLDLGLRHSTLTLVAERTPVYIRVLTGTAQDWTRRLASAFEISYGQADQLKRTYGVQVQAPGTRPQHAGCGPQPALSQTSPAALPAGELASAFSGVLREPLRDLAVEIGRCFGYVMQSYSEHAVKQLLLAGGGANLSGLASVLEAELDIPVVPLVEPYSLKGRAGAPAEDLVQGPTRAAVALGGALLDLENP